MKTYFFTSLLSVFLSFALSLEAKPLHSKNKNLYRADITLKSIFKLYSTDNPFLFRETYPYNEKHKVTYLTSDQPDAPQNLYSYLWPFSGSLSAVVSIYQNNKDASYLQILENRIMPGLDLYFDTKRDPGAYASYIEKTPTPDRFYDDNVWIGIDFTDLYLLTKEKKYLSRATATWNFIESGTDSILGGGIYWCEQKKFSKNTCSNAPGAVFALKLFEATSDSSYFHKGKNLYEWTKANLQDKKDYLFYDNINLNGEIEKTKFAYNSGQMMQAAALLYKCTKDGSYLKEAQDIAQSCHNYFFYDYTTNKGAKISLPKGDIWFTTVMYRGFIELYGIDKNRKYIDFFKSNLDYAWNYMREDNGLFNKDWTAQTKDDSKWLLTQFAMVEMYARLNKL